MRTKKEIKEQIRLLRLQRKGIPAFSSFGDNNHKRIDGEIAALEKALTLSEADVKKQQDRHMDDEDGTVLRTFDWILGESDESPVEDGEDDIWIKKAKAV